MNSEIYTLSLHDALPIFGVLGHGGVAADRGQARVVDAGGRVCLAIDRDPPRSEEHTSELQSRGHIVCRRLLEKKKKRVDRLFRQSSRTLYRTFTDAERLL